MEKAVGKRVVDKKYCNCCLEEKNIEEMRVHSILGDGRVSYRSYCNFCWKNFRNECHSKNIKSKICRWCNIRKPLSEMQVKGLGKNGNILYEPYCKDNCYNLWRKNYNDVYYKTNLNQIKIKAKQYRNKQDKTAVAAYNKQYYLNNREKLLLQCKEYRKNNLEAVKATQRKNYEENKDAIILKTKNYYQANKEDIAKKSKEKYKNMPELDKIKRNEKNREYRLLNRKVLNAKAVERHKNDLIHRLKMNVSRIINIYLKRAGSSKGNLSVLKYLKYTIRELKIHLESLFESWMTWDNYGKYNKKIWNDDDRTTWKWNLDHIIPQSDLPYEDMECENFKKCWDLSNLRPYSAKQNSLDGVNRTRHKGNE